MGIAPENLVRIFEPFDRLGAENSEIEGTGIGMAISKKLIELMNGNIEVDSTLGKGSQFSVSLPYCHTVGINNGKNSQNLENSSLEFSKKDFTILYIEDNQANMLLVQDILSEFQDIKLLTAPQAVIGLDLANAYQPNLILLDINLPDIDGFEAFKRLQNMEETHDIPVIAISANAMQKDIDRALAFGFRNYLTKPINISQFKSTVKKFLV